MKESIGIKDEKVDNSVRGSERRHLWERIISEFEASGLSGAAFCRERGLAPWQLSYWRKALRKNKIGGSGFVELSVGGSVPGVWVECGRWRISVDRGFDSRVLRRVVEALS
jgi:hypothetical protein